MKEFIAGKIIKYEAVHVFTLHFNNQIKTIINSCI